MNPFKAIQQRLPLDLSEARIKPPPHPGDLSFEEWAEREDVVHHGTFMKDWDQTAATHFGDPDAARMILKGAHSAILGGSGYGPLEEEDMYEELNLPEEESMISEGTIHSRRLPEGSVATDPHGDRRVFSDRAANTAHLLHEMSRFGGRGSPSVRETVAIGWGMDRGEDIDEDYLQEELESRDTRSSRAALDATDQLEAGKTLAYNNTIEGGISYVVPNRGARDLRTWEQDVAGSPNVPPHVKDFVARRTAERGPRHLPAARTSYGVRTYQEPLPLEREGGGQFPGLEGKSSLQRVYHDRQKLDVIRYGDDR